MRKDWLSIGSCTSAERIPVASMADSRLCHPGMSSPVKELAQLVISTGSHLPSSYPGGEINQILSRAASSASFNLHRFPMLKSKRMQV